MGQARQNVVRRRGQAYGDLLRWLGGERTHLAAKLLFSTLVILIIHLPTLRTCLVLGLLLQQFGIAGQDRQR